jgi:hypothetical protein
VYAFATVLQLPFHLLIGLPWFLVAWAAWRFSRPFARRPRASLVAIPIAGGLAPAYGFHASMMPAYAILISERSYWLAAFVSFALTWALVFSVLLWLTRSREKNGGAQSNL